LVGEVWLGSGQSNMGFTVDRGKDAATEKKAATFPMIRLFQQSTKTSKTPDAIGAGKWTECSPETIGPFSAALFFFGRELHTTLKVPVGLIMSAVGGTTIEQWIDADTQRQMAELKPFFAGPMGVGGRVNMEKVGGLFNGKIHPLIPYALRGAIWYQG